MEAFRRRFASSREATGKVRQPSRPESGTCRLLPPKNATGQRSPAEVNVARVDEIGREEAPIRWVLLTTEPTDEFENALAVIGHSRTRWTIEDSCTVLKTGCRTRGRRLETSERMEVLLAIRSVIAWKVLQL
jgi:hypothetical protein